MKKVLPVIIVIIVAAALWFAVSARVGNEPATPPAGVNAGSEAPAVSANQPPGESEQVGAGESGGRSRIEAPDGEDGDPNAQAPDRSATELYKTADEALKAIKDAAADYDDLVLDQFTEPGPNCTWCDSFYSQLKELIQSPETRPDQKSYFAEVLAISGRVDNLKTLVDGITSAKNDEEADLYAEALELTVGKDDVVRYLGDQLKQNNEKLREASVAAITNQGSRLSVELLYNHTIEKGDPDGYYSMGIGLGEVVPEESALPLLQDLVAKRDQYSHLAFKGMLNAGVDGLKTAFDILSSSRNPDFDREMIKGAIDHVSYDDDSMSVVRQVAESNKGVAADFAKEILASFAQSQEEEAAGEAEEGAPPMSLPQPVQ